MYVVSKVTTDGVACVLTFLLCPS